jgi:hypothetical protein
VKYFDPGDYWNSGFYIPTDIELNWNYCDNTVFYPAAVHSYLDRIQVKPNEIVIIWGAPNRLTMYPECIAALNNFASSIPNRVIMFNGNYAPKDLNNIEFEYSEFSYFEHVARCTWNQEPALPKRRRHPFMMLGTKDYPNRKYLLSRIVQSGVDKDALISYKQVNSNELNLGNYSQEQIDAIKAVAEQVNSRLPWPALDNSVEFTQMPKEFLLQSYINMVTDTFYEGEVFVSEKVYTAIAHGQMFVMLAPAGTLAYLRRQGYRTFSKYIDESYDAIQDNYARLQAVTELIIKLAQSDLPALYKSCESTVLHNQQHFYSRNLNSDFVNILRG